MRSLLLGLLLTGVPSWTASEPDPKAIYLHPVLVLVTAVKEGFPLLIPVTFENEWAGGRSLAFQLTLGAGGQRLEGATFVDSRGKVVVAADQPLVDVLGIKWVASLRLYFNGERSQGFYFAPAIGYEFATVDLKEGVQGDVYWRAGSGSTSTYSVLGFLGYRWKGESLTVYADFGLGYAYQSSVVEKAWGEGTKKFLTRDLNLGVGVPF